MPEPSELRNLIAETTTAAETAAEPAQVDNPEPATDAPAKSETPVGERARGPDGKFLPKAEHEDAEPSEDPEGEPSEAEGEEGEPEKPEVKEPTVEVPKHWTQSDKDLIAKLPSEHRQAVVDRYKAIEAGFQPKLIRAAELEKQFGPAEEIFKPYAEALRQRNLTASDYVRAWASAELTFLQGMQDLQQGRPNQKGAQLVATLIRQYRVDPGDVAAILQGQPLPQQNGAAPPAVVLPPEIAQEINDLKQWRANTEQTTRQRAEAGAQRQIDTFAAEKDAQGNLLRPYFAELESEISRLAKLDADDGKPIDLADLYDRAAYANRSTREKLLEAKDAQAKQKALAERKAKAVAAQRASSSVTGSPGSSLPPSEGRGRAKSLREELESNAADYETA